MRLAMQMTSGSSDSVDDNPTGGRIDAMASSRSSTTRAAKISITVDDAVLREVRKVARRRGQTLSAHVNQTLQDDLRRRKLAALIEAYEAEHGEITEAELARARAARRFR
jgi:hypothetical protein